MAWCNDNTFQFSDFDIQMQIVFTCKGFLIISDFLVHWMVLQKNEEI